MDAIGTDLANEDALSSFGAALAPIAARARILEPPMPHERASVLRNEAGLLLDGLLTRVARGRGALDVALGEGLAALAEGDRAIQLGYSGIVDYARERLGIAARTAQTMAQLAHGLRERPLLREAVRRGEVSARKALTVLPAARGDDEATWVERARTETVRALSAAVRGANGDAAAAEEDERWERIWLDLPPQERAALDEAMALAGKLLGVTAPRWQRLEAICQEFVGAHPMPEGPIADTVFHTSTRNWLEAAKIALEEETRWAFLGAVEPVAAPGIPGDSPADHRRLDEEMGRLMAMRNQWDDVLGHVAMLVRMLGLWRDMKFASFGHYCAERLGMAERTVEQRIALERRLAALPALRTAMRAGRVSYEKARLVARRADERSVEAWIARAEKATCVGLRREIEAHEEAQMCARRALDLGVPARLVGLLASAIEAARTAAGRWIPQGECLGNIARHFVETWKEALAERNTVQRRVLERDGGLCQVPGCSRAAVHAHHVVYRSRGGADDAPNLVSLCAVHHLRCVHRGYIRIRGRAPDHLRWELNDGSARPKRLGASTT